MTATDVLPVTERIRRTLVALRMPRALELLDHAVRQLERGEASALELIDTQPLQLRRDIALRCHRVDSVPIPAPPDPADQCR